jgi:DNA polymerase III epsilon subunit-like protein
MILAYDTETTGLPDFKNPSDAPHQPHIVQLAAMLINPITERPVVSVNLIVRPDGWTIPDEVAAIHGITQDIAMAVGVSETLVTQVYMELINQAELRVAHNVSFDDRIMRIAMLRFGMDRAACEVVEARPKFCTMGAASKIMNMPPTEKMQMAGFTKPKPPKLAEAMQYFFAEKLEGAHNALHDVAATARLYFKLQNLPVAS